MTMEIKIPEIGESIASGVLAAWLKVEGDLVREGEPLFDLDSDKATLAVPAEGQGMLHILVPAGDEVEIGQVVGTLTSMDVESAPEKDDRAVIQTAPGKPTTTEPATPVSPAAEPTPSNARANTPQPDKPATLDRPATASPAQKPSTPSDARAKEQVPMSLIRKRTAERLLRARSSSAHLTTFNEINLQKVVDIRAHYQASFLQEHGIKIGFMSFFVKACCHALGAYPVINSRRDGDNVVFHHYHDIGVAISTARGLVVPVIRDADHLSFAELERRVASLAERARNKALLPEELTGGTFTITNGGVFGSMLSTPIPAHPQVAVLGMHAITRRPVAEGDQVVIRPMMYAALSYDHCLVDGHDAIGFLVKVKELIEDPDKLLLEM